ncbi:Imm1 family immunity protein [Roseateles sp. NT4]|uniref:Imm1 family immunity protein n=1 Tax=Roseateles sp. NT4 TaxID=3453715 RepID=UPI003EE8986A
MNADTIAPKHCLQIRSEAELESAFQACKQGAHAAFHLSHDQPYPWLSVLVNGSLACTHYFPEPAHPGWQSLNPDPAAGEGTTRFLQAGGCEADDFDMPEYTLVSAEAELAAAKEFLLSPERPSCIRWAEL